MARQDSETQPKVVSLRKRALKAYRFVQHAFGFKKTYNFPLYIITVGALCGFLLARLKYLDVEHEFFKSAIPGEAYWYQKGHRRVGIFLHLIGVIPGGLLAVLQFTPIIRYKALWLHRICGYLSVILYLMGNVGAFMIVDHAIGGVPAMQVCYGVLGTATTLGLFNAFINIKRLQIDQHRAWMIRTWTWGSNIITLRLILLAAEKIVDTYGIELLTPMRCEEVFFMYTFNAGLPADQNPTSSLYPACGPDASTSPRQIAVSSIGTGPENSAAKLRPLFLAGTWLAIFLHAFFAELYLSLTPAESHRLRVVSRQRQIERGFIKPDQMRSAGIDATTLGDVPEWWSVPIEKRQMVCTETNAGIGSPKLDVDFVFGTIELPTSLVGDSGETLHEDDVKASGTQTA